MPYHRTTLVRHAEVIMHHSNGVHHCDMPYYSPAGALGIIYKYKNDAQYRDLIDEIINKKKEEFKTSVSNCKLSVNRSARIYYEYLKIMNSLDVKYLSLSSLYIDVAKDKFSIQTVRNVIKRAQKNPEYKQQLLKYIDECIETK